MQPILIRKTPLRRGFSLIELVVVLVILAIVSGLVVTIAGWVRRSANYGAASQNQSAIAANLELYRTTYGNNAYPDRFDSLLTASGTVPTYMHSELSAMITPTDLTQDHFDCFRGITKVMDHADDLSTAIEGNPGNTGITLRALAVKGKVAFVNPTSANGLQLVNMLYPDGMPTGTSLVLMGVGPSCAAVGRTMQSPPFFTVVDPSKEYNRFIAVFAVYSPREGRRAQLKAVLDSRGRTPNRNLSEFWQSTNPD